MGRRMRWSCAATIATFLIEGGAAAQNQYPDVHVVSITASTAFTHFELTFDRPVCAGSTPASRARVVKTLSPHYELLFSAAMAAYLSNFRVRVQTSNDERCEVQAFELRR